MGIFKSLFGQKKDKSSKFISSTPEKTEINIPLTTEPETPTIRKRKIDDIDLFYDQQSKVIKIIIEQNSSYLKDALARYIEVLRVKSSQLTYEDDYGDLVVDDWNRELYSFIENKMVEENEMLIEKCANYMWNNYYFDRTEIHWVDGVNDLNEGFGDFLKFGLSNFVNDWICEIEIEKIESETDQGPIYCDEALNDPIKFEEAVAKDFRSMGWEARTTSGSGDQGADVIAERNGVKWIVQCKLYSQPVGNKAVQEVHSANGFYKGNIPLVITNSTFTKSALQLSESLNVITIHHSVLNSLLQHSIEKESSSSE